MLPVPTKVIKITATTRIRARTPPRQSQRCRRLQRGSDSVEVVPRVLPLLLPTINSSRQRQRKRPRQSQHRSWIVTMTPRTQRPGREKTMPTATAKSHCKKKKHNNNNNKSNPSRQPAPAAAARPARVGSLGDPLFLVSWIRSVRLQHLPRRRSRVQPVPCTREHSKRRESIQTTTTTITTFPPHLQQNSAPQLSSFQFHQRRA